MKKYSIALDLLLSSVAAAKKGKLQTAGKLYEAALRAKDIHATVATLDKEQGEAMTAMKAAQAQVAARKTAKQANGKKATASAGKQLASFLKEVNDKRTAAKASAPKKTGKKVKAETDTDKFNETMDEMTQANAGDDLDPLLDLVDDGEDDGGDAPPAATSRPTPAVADMDGDPSDGMGESDLDTDQDDLMDIQDDLDDLTDLSNEDFLGAATDDEDDESDDGEDEDEDDDNEEDASSDDDEDEDDGDSKGKPFGGKKAPPFGKKDGDKKDDKEEGTAKKAFSQTIGNLAALDRISELTASLVDGNVSKKKTSAKVAKTASKK